ncbi:MAG: acyl-CoA synthetase [Desulfobacteraceae bacterium]|nr:acyl-CoA synthetase [Desulfobacteraceae bacterium]MBC2756234.1 acyl-CoA synthetase [Desulfobacteraceae bacterium]
METYKIATLPDIEAIEKVPFAERLKISNTYDIIKQGAAINPDAPAISLILSGDHYADPLQVTYREFWAKVNQTANLLHDLGVGPQDVVSFLLPNLHLTHHVIWGGEAAGIVNPLNPLLEPSTIKEICQAAKTKVLVALGEYPGADIWEKVVAIRNDLPDLKAIIRVMGPSDEKEGIYGYDEVITKYNEDKLDSKRLIDPQDVASIYGTAGTTGRPKLAPRTHFNEAAITTILPLVVGQDLKTGDTALTGLPLFHANATMATGLYPFSIGGHVVLLSPKGYRDPSIIQNFYKIVEHYKAVTFSCVPTVLSALLEVPEQNADISSLNFCICGAAPLSVDLFRRFEAHSGMKIIEGYGLTEGTLCSSINPLFGSRKVGSVGLRIPYQEMKIFVEEKDNFRPADTDEIGCICIKGPNVFSGYLEEEHNKGIWLKDGWFNTGDLGRQDADGYLWLTGRKKDLIIRGGHNIDPESIEDPLYRLPGVKFAAAVGCPDAYAGEIPVVYVQLQEGTDLTKEKIAEFLNKEVGERAAVPKDVFIVDEMPITPIGKIFKPVLRWDSIQRVFETDLKGLGDLVDSIIVNVAENKIHGTMATLSVKPADGILKETIESKINEILGCYTIRYQLEIV